MKAHFRLAVCLYELDKLKDSKMYLDLFTLKYPSYRTSAAYKSLCSDLLNAQANKKDKFNGNYYKIIFVFIFLVFCINYLLFLINCI